MKNKIDKIYNIVQNNFNINHINYSKINDLAINEMALNKYYNNYENLLDIFFEKYKIDDVPEKIIRQSIMHSAQQFNFFYGNHKSIDSKIIYEILFNLNKDDDFINYLKLSDLNFIPERIDYYYQSLIISMDIFNIVNCIIDKNNIDELRHKIILIMMNGSCFANDPLFKRGLLAIIEIRRFLDALERTRNNLLEKNIHFKQLNRIFSKEFISTFPIPADYRIPQWLIYNQILPEPYIKEYISNTNEEITMRSNTIVAINEIAKVKNIPAYDLDGYIFNNKINNNNFPKCSTTAY